MQAICLEREDDGSSANFLLSPFKMMAAMFNYILGQIAWTIIRFEIHHLWNPDWTYAFPQGLGELETDQYVIYHFFFHLTNSGDSFTNLEFRIYNFFNEYLF